MGSGTAALPSTALPGPPKSRRLLPPPPPHIPPTPRLLPPPRRWGFNSLKRVIFSRRPSPPCRSEAPGRAPQRAVFNPPPPAPGPAAHPLPPPLPGREQREGGRRLRGARERNPVGPPPDEAGSGREAESGGAGEEIAPASTPSSLGASNSGICPRTGQSTGRLDPSGGTEPSPGPVLPPAPATASPGEPHCFLPAASPGPDGDRP